MSLLFIKIIFEDFKFTHMKHCLKLLCLLLSFSLFSCSNPRQIDIYATTDLHGLLLPFDNTEGEPVDHSLSNLASLVEEKGNQNIVLLDNGDILQGDPLAYYYNFIDTSRIHVVADILNYLGYDAATAGNHDFETGHFVYDRIRKEYDFPLLAANAIDERSGEPYFKPYTVIKKKGYKIVVFGLITPSVPKWLPKSLYNGIRFEGMVETAKKWMPIIKSEDPDIIIGLFHSGLGNEDNPDDDENSTLAVATNVPGFDVIFAGHDHNKENKTVTDIEGNIVLVLDGGSRAYNLMHAKVMFGEQKSVKITSGEVIAMNSLPQSASFNKRYESVSDTLNQFTSEVIGSSSVSISTRDAYFGPSAFVDLIHTIQLDITGADISFAAPLSFDEFINKGEIRVRDMFRLYRFENFLYTVNMTGHEVDRYLEHSYGLWLNTMSGKNDYLLKYRTDDKGMPVLVNDMLRLRNASYNFDSALGIKYTVDVSKNQGERVSVSSFSDGRPFCPDSAYTVAVNSYRASGGGGHFAAAGIDHEVLGSRIVSSTDRDLRYYLKEWISQKGEIKPMPIADWSIIPATWTSEARKREMKLLFREN